MSGIRSRSVELQIGFESEHYPFSVQPGLEGSHSLRIHCGLGQVIPIAEDSIAEGEFSEIRIAVLISNLISMAPCAVVTKFKEDVLPKVVNALNDTECLDHVHSPSPIQEAGKVHPLKALLIGQVL